MNRHFNNQLRVVVMTDTNLYKFDPEKKFKQSKAPIPIKDIASVVITEEAEFQLIVLKLKSSLNDFIFYIERKDPSLDKVPEFIANIYRARIKYKIIVKLFLKF